MFAYTKLMQAMSGAVAVVTDAYFNLVTLLLNTTATNGAQNNTFLDSSTNNFTITRNGNTTQGTFTPFSQTGWGTHFTGTSGTRLTYPGSASTYVSGTGDFTIEMWINIDAASAGHSRILIEGDVSNGIQFRLGPSNTTNINGLSVSRVFNADNEYCDFTFAFSTWYHVAVCRASAVYYFFVNGVQYTTQGSGTATYDFQVPSTVSIGDNASYPNDEIYKGYISNIRVSNVARYTSNFTPSTTPLTALSGTQFLSLQNNRWIDNSTNNSTITSVGSSGTPSVQAFSPFLPTTAYDAAVVGGSGYFTTSDYLTFSSNSAFSFGTGDFTVELWYYPLAVNLANNNFLDTRNAGGSSSGIFVKAVNTTITAVFDATDFSAAGLVGNSWNHVAVTRSGTTVRVYVNGVSGTSGTSSKNLSDSGLIVNKFVDGGVGINGYTSSLRIVKGTAVYTGTTLTIPTAPLTAISGTSALLSYTNSGIFDSAAKNVAETVGNAQVSTTQAKFGTTSMAFDGTGDNLKSKLTNAIGGGDYTIEGFFYIAGTGTQYLFDIRETSQYIGAYIVSSTTTLYVNFGTTLDTSASSAFTLNSWNHLAFVRSGSGSNNTSVFLNGSRVTQVTDTTNYSIVPNIFIGCENSGNYYLNGYVDEFRITKGYARYSGSTYTVPTAAFPLQ